VRRRAQRYGQGSLFRRTVLEHIAEDMLSELAPAAAGAAAAGAAAGPGAADPGADAAAPLASCPITHGARRRQPRRAGP